MAPRTHSASIAARAMGPAPSTARERGLARSRETAAVAFRTYLARAASAGGRSCRRPHIDTGPSAAASITVSIALRRYISARRGYDTGCATPQGTAGGMLCSMTRCVCAPLHAKNASRPVARATQRPMLLPLAAMPAMQAAEPCLRVSASVSGVGVPDPGSLKVICVAILYEEEGARRAGRDAGLYELQTLLTATSP